MKNENQEINEKREKAGSPLFVLIIFIALIGFVFIIPEVYKKYNKDIADFLGVGKSEGEKTTVDESKETDEIIANSAFYQIGSKSTFTYNKIKFSDISLENNILKMHLETDGTLEFDKLDYYIEFYQNQSTFVGRRRLNGILTNVLDISFDVSNMNIDTTTYIMVSHISDDGIPSIELTSGEDGLSELTCVNGNYSYTYEFSQKRLYKVLSKYTYQSNLINDYTEKLLEYQKKEKEYNEFNGVTSQIIENSGNFIFASEFDYSTVKSFNRINDRLIFSKDIADKTVKFKMEAEGFDCK